MRQFTYAVKLTPDKDDGGYVVTCRDLPEAITQGETIEQAVVEAADCLLGLEAWLKSVRGADYEWTGKSRTRQRQCIH